jgi:hypothetical protein
MHMIITDRKSSAPFVLSLGIIAETYQEMTLFFTLISFELY